MNYMNNLNERDFQYFVIDFFKNNLNYQYKKNFELFDEELRENKKEFLLKPILLESLKRINPNKSEKQINEAIFAIEKITNANLVLANKDFFNLIKDGIDTFREKTKSYQKVFLFDRNEPLNNDFLIVDEFEFSGIKNKRCDLVVFVNGLPLSIIEFKNPYDENLTIDKAFTQIKNYQNDIKELFITNCFNTISNNFNNGVGTITTNFERYTEFKNERGEQSWKNHFSGLYSKRNLIEMITNYLIFTKENEKIIASYHQFFCTKKIIQKSLLANENKTNQVGVVWHTTGSGKSLTMVFYVKQLLEKIKPLVIILTDRNDLDEQLFSTFARCSNFLNVNQGLKQINSRQNLIDTLNKNTKSEIIFTTIQKFLTDENKTDFEKLSDRDDIFIIADEAHRSQYDTIDGLAKNLRDALPNAKFLGFTGTPVELENRNTKLIFGSYIDKYVMSRAVADKTTVPINYEPRLAKIGLKQEMMPQIDKKAEELFEVAEVKKQKVANLKMEAIISNEKRLKLIAKDFITHYEKREQIIQGKVLFATISRKVALKLYDILKELKPKWFDDEDKKGQVKVVISGGSSDDINFQKHIRDKKGLKEIEKRFKDEKDNLKIVIVANMWLTGFDLPCLHTLYIDKPLKEHTLIQAISRVNRVYKNKDSGLIVDYIGIGHFLKQAIYNFSNEDKKEIIIDFDAVIKKLIEHYEMTKSYFKDFDYSDFFTITDKKLKQDIIKNGVDKVVINEKNKKDFLLECLKLLKTYALCPLSDEAKKIVQEISFFKLVRYGVLNLTKNIKNLSSQINLTKELNEIVSKSIETKGVVNIYDFVGVKNPQISILDEDFFDEIRNLKQKNLAYELLKKVLSDKIKIIAKGNIALEKKFSKKLQELVRQYENKTIESAKIIGEMINMTKDIINDIEEKKKLGLNEDEIKFYYAISQINNEREVMKTDILKDLAKELVVKIRKNKTIDWHKRENTRAKMRLMIKKLLKKYNYPPDGMEEARELVLAQAKVFCDEI